MKEWVAVTGDPIKGLDLRQGPARDPASPVVRVPAATATSAGGTEAVAQREKLPKVGWQMNEVPAFPVLQIILG